MKFSAEATARVRASDLISKFPVSFSSEIVDANSSVELNFLLNKGYLVPA